MKSGQALLFIVAAMFLVTMSFKEPIVTAPSTATPTPNPCSSTVAKSSVSPDGAWTAILADNACEGAYAFESAAYWTVSVVSKINSSNAGVVFTYDDDGNAATKPAIKWTASESLQITAQQKLGTASQASSFSTVTVSYIFSN